MTTAFPRVPTKGLYQMLVIEFRRRCLRLSQEELATHPQVRIHQAFLSLIERGMGVPTTDQACRLAAVLGVEPNDLLKTAVIDLPTTTPAAASRG